MTTDQMINIGLALIGALSLRMISNIEKAIVNMGESIEKLNTNVAVVVERVDSHERRINNLEKH